MVRSVTISTIAMHMAKLLYICPYSQMATHKLNIILIFTHKFAQAIMLKMKVHNIDASVQKGYVSPKKGRQPVM